MDNNTKNTNKEPGLIARLNTMFHSPIIKQGVPTLMLAAAMLLGSTSCSLPPEGPGSSNVGTSNKGQNNNNKYSQYTELLQNVLNNEYYNQLIEQAKKDPSIYETNGEFKQHPYAFLEDEGYNIQAIKNGDIACYTGTYVLKNEPNNLYIYTRVETKSNEPYFTEYILKYKLTKKEMEEYKMMFEGYHVQAIFLNNIVSELKEPTIVSEVRCTVEAHNNLLSALKKHDHTSVMLNKLNLGSITLMNFDENNGTFQVLIKSKNSLNSLITAGKINIITLFNGSLIVAANEDSAFYKPSNYNEFWFKTSENTTEPQSAAFYDITPGDCKQATVFMENTK